MNIQSTPNYASQFFQLVPSDVVVEALLHELVGLVQHEHPDGLRLEVLLLDELLDPAGGPDGQVAGLQLPHVVLEQDKKPNTSIDTREREFSLLFGPHLHTHSSNERVHLDLLHLRGHLQRHPSALHGDLPGGGHHQHAGAEAGRRGTSIPVLLALAFLLFALRQFPDLVQPRQGGHHVDERLARAGLGLHHQVQAQEGGRQGAGLHGRGPREPGPGHAAQDPVGQAQVGEGSPVLRGHVPGAGHGGGHVVRHGEEGKRGRHEGGAGIRERHSPCGMVLDIGLLDNPIMLALALAMSIVNLFVF